MTLPYILGLVVAILGPSGLVFGALHYNRDEAGKVVKQQTDVLTSMQSLNNELTEALDRIRGERDALIEEVKGCRDDIRLLRAELASATSRMGGNDA